MNTATLLDLISARQAAAIATADDLRQQITQLTSELAGTEAELSDLAITHQTLTKLTHHELSTSEPTITSASYQQIIAVFTPGAPGMRAKDVCLALGLGATTNDAEGLRDKLKRLVTRQILVENQKGLFTLAQRT